MADQYQYEYPDPEEAQGYSWKGFEDPTIPDDAQTTHDHSPGTDPEFSPQELGDDDDNEFAEEGRYLDLHAPLNDVEDDDGDYQMSGESDDANDNEDGLSDDSKSGSSSEVEESVVNRFVQEKFMSSLAARQKRAESPKNRRGGGRIYGPRKAAEPSQEVAMLLREVNEAWIDNDLERAEETANLILLKNNEIFTAYSHLTEIQYQQGKIKQSLQTMFAAAHLRPREPGMWRACAERTLSLAQPGRKDKYHRQAIYCLMRAISVDRMDFEARKLKASIEMEMEQYPAAIRDYEFMLNALPHEITLLRGLGQACLATGQYERAVAQYKESFDFYKSFHNIESDGVSWSDVAVFVELMARCGNINEAIVQLKSLSRWRLGREEDQFWDDVKEDDREWDLEDGPRRYQAPEFFAGKHEDFQYGAGLPLEIRVKLGILRLQQGPAHLTEAVSHFSWLNPEDETPEAAVFSYPNLFQEVGDSLLKAGLPSNALSFYEPLQMVETFSDTSFLLSMADCFRQIDSKYEAQQCYLLTIDRDGSNIEARMKLAEVLESLGFKEEALSYAQAGVKLRQEADAQKKRDESDSEDDTFIPTKLLSRSSIKPRKHKKRVYAKPREKQDEAAKRQQQRQQLQLTVSVLRTTLAQTSVMETEPGSAPILLWIEKARELLDIFCTTTHFFPSERYTRFFGYTLEARKQAVNQRRSRSNKASLQVGILATLTEEIPTEYLGISFDDWFDICLEFATVLTRENQAREAYSVLDKIKAANIFLFDDKKQLQVNCCVAACALHANDEATLIKVSRWFMTTYQFQTPAYLMFSALCRMNRSDINWYNSGPTQKYVLRQIKALDYYLLPEDEREQEHFRERAALQWRDGELAHGEPTELNTALLMLYGQMLYAGTSYAFALNYFFRCFALEPHNPIVCLYIGLSYLHMATKRQSENRHQLIMQGTTFMYKYWKTRSKSKLLVERMEAEYNIARGWHAIGLNHLAVGYYQRVLEFAKEAKDNEEDGGRKERYELDAAYNLKIMVTMSRNPALAGSFVADWLVV
ncbi:MAG: transcription factor TFIIIC subunit tfc4 [Vezdaea aestivalis]|nr:MAG: transcription factor TFIIIC subunit tfc4 [Vezdaea aestivalis]